MTIVGITEVFQEELKGWIQTQSYSVYVIEMVSNLNDAFKRQVSTLQKTAEITNHHARRWSCKTGR